MTRPLSGDAAVGLHDMKAMTAEWRRVPAAHSKWRRALGLRLFASLFHVAWLLQPRVSAAEATGSLLIESEPAGAAVYVDGRPVGETPLTLAAIAAGVHRVRVLRLGYLENSRLMTIKAGTRATLRVRLTDPAPQAPSTAALKIVVLDGEGGVNIVQQKTAVAPVIEVRDRNDQPVAGAVVRFAIQKGRASFSGARTITATADAAGRATATGLTPTGSGALQIGATATYQGQTAVVTITQTNVMTAAQAAAASGAGASGGGSGAGTAGGAAGGAGGGGSLSTTTIAIVGGAVAGGAFVAKEVAGGKDTTSYSGPFSGPLVTIVQTGLTSCSFTDQSSGTVTLDIKVSSDGAVTGTGDVSGTLARVASSCGGNTTPALAGSQPNECCNPSPQVTGTRASLGFTASHPGNPGVTATYEFSGALNGSEITGTFTLTISQPSARAFATAAYPVTLR